ncbi:MAG: Stk1 family PASTA domain-containing Ser/Thr kinase [Bifidobacteriaceae bacterium]|jgi:serine/threonine-protein kinase|nr:Stk1 family PASTA domain-containing Ser/Thr kinase [Bifidobacteriaceae bacterium]
MTMPQVLGGRYELREMVGQGGMAEVHKAFDNRLQRVVAVKILRPALTQDLVFYSRFKREAEAAASLNHPNIVAVYDTGEEIVDNSGSVVKYPYIVMEFIQGDDLKTIIAKQNQVNPQFSAKIMQGVLDALEYSHKHGVIHRDIKPGNIFISSSGQVKVMDFGIARAVADSSATMTQANTVVGTAQYLSPEQAKGSKVDARSDLYSAGCLLFELLTGQPPFSGENAVSIAYQHVSENHQKPSEIVSGLNPLWDQIVSRAMAKDPNMRYQTAFSFKADVEAAAGGRNLPSADETTVLNPVSASMGLPNDVYDDGSQTKIMPAIKDDINAGQKTKKSKKVPLIISLVILLVIGITGAVIWTSCGVKVTVPRLAANVTPVEAKQQIEAAKLVYEQLPDASSTLPKDTFTHSDPIGGTQVNQGSTVKVYFSAGPEDLTVPDLKNSSQDVAQKTLSDLGLTVGSIKTEDSPDVAKDNITRTSPEAGSKIQKGQTIILYISTGNVALPDLTGKTRDQADDEVKKLHLIANFQDDKTDDKTPGTVTKTNPTAGSVQQNSTIIIYIAVPKTITIPDLEGKMKAEAIRAIQQLGLLPQVEYQSSSSPKDTVISTSPLAGQKVSPNSSVTIYVSNGG